MGKKSKAKRKSGPSGGASGPSSAPGARPQEEETLDNLRFEDPFEDEFADDDDMEIVDASAGDGLTGGGGGRDAGTTVLNETGGDDGAAASQRKAWMPGTELNSDEVLEYDQSAYTMYHAMKPEWPCLSFDILPDTLGTNRTRFPHTMTAVAGTQADEAKKNKLTVMRLGDMGRTYKKPSGEDSDDEDAMSDSDSDGGGDNTDDDPTLDHRDIPHYGGVNRVRCMPQRPSVVASHGATGHVHLWDVSSHLASFEKGGGGGALNNRALQSHGGHKDEGYAMDWSRKEEGALVTGDCAGGIHLWKPGEGGKWAVTPGWEAGTSVEDLQWSPSEATVFASADCNKNISIFDVRKTGSPMLAHKAHESDVNVISWNRNVTNLLASGSDDGVFSVWDLRMFGKDPLARFTTHTTPITSLEWHPTDESMIVVSDESAVFVYDLSVEEDAEEIAKTNALAEDENAIPAQLLFLHAGSVSNKECHWHPQIPSLVMTTALTGFNVFIPSNL